MKQQTKFFLATAAFTVVASNASLASAAIPPAVLKNLQCTDEKTVDCIKDGIFVMKGGPELAGLTGAGTVTYGLDPNPIINTPSPPLKEPGYYCGKGSNNGDALFRWDCRLDYDKVIDRFMTILKAAGWTVDSKQWDQVAVFGVDIEEAGTFGGRGLNPMNFYRVPSVGTDHRGTAVESPTQRGANEIDGIGKPLLPRNPNFPFLGYTVGGSTSDFGVIPTNTGAWFPEDEDVLPMGLEYWPAPNPAGTFLGSRYRQCSPSSMCNAYLNGFQTLAQAVSQMYGPFVSPEPDLDQAGGAWLAVPTLDRSECAAKDDGSGGIRIPWAIACKGAQPQGAVTTLPAVGDAGPTNVYPPPAAVECNGLVPVANPMYAVEAGKKVVNLGQGSGTRAHGIKDGKPATPIGVPDLFEPSLSVCPSNKKNIATAMRAPSAQYNATTLQFHCPTKAFVVEWWDPIPPGTLEPDKQKFEKFPKLCTGAAAGASFYRIEPRFWNSMLDMDGSLMGSGSNWIENANRTASNTVPAANWTGSPPYRGRSLSTFHPAELWLMGLIPYQDAANPLNAIPSIRAYNFVFDDLIGETVREPGKFNSEAGPRMGLPKEGLTQGAQPMRAVATGKSWPFTFEQLLKKAPVRSPTHEMDNHTLRVPWIVVTKPEERYPRDNYPDCEKKLRECAVDPTMHAGDPDCDLVRQKNKMPLTTAQVAEGKTANLPEGCLAPPEALDKINNRHIDYMVRWRKSWQAYWYMLTSYRGRMVSDFEAVNDDSAYWEFMQKIDDQRYFQPEGGLASVVSGPHDDIDTAAITSFANVATPGAAGKLRYANIPNRPALLIRGDQKVQGANNVLLIRMMVPKSVKVGSVAKLELDNGPTITIPSEIPAMELRGIKGLVNDGQFHTYSVELGESGKVPDFGKADYTGFSFSPSNNPTSADCNPEDLDNADCIKIDYIRFTNVVDPKEIKDEDRTCTNQLKPDGWIGGEDNCPDLYNPDQLDADRNGRGDACEDADQDSIPDGCDNCPSLTNARQSDENGDGIGDLCDETYGSGCFLTPDAVGGRPSANPTGNRSSLALLGLFVAGAFVLLRRRRR